jgi:uncharacterized protein
MTCPICKRKVKPGNPDEPFCSERCRTADLANWATGKYAIPVESVDPDQPESEDD